MKNTDNKQHGIDRALAVFRAAVKTVPAYQKLLRQKRIAPGIITNRESFERLPIIEKAHYVCESALQDLFPSGQIPPFAYASSGSSGTPRYWFRGDQEEAFGASVHETIFNKVFGIQKHESTLAVVCFSMGLWIAGNYTAAVCREISRKGYAFTTITPGIEKEEILNALKTLGPQFRHIILAGYPPFLMDVVVEAQRRHIPLRKKVKLLTAGDKISEGWRDAINTHVGNKDPYHTNVNLYGCADVGILGFETPLSIFIRKSALADKSLYRILFGDEANTPALAQYDPAYIYFETVNGELVFSVNSAMPLVRYNIHDLGALYSFTEMLQILKDFKLDVPAKRYSQMEWRLPFVVKKGRTDVAVTTYALNIYPEHIRAGVEDKRVEKYLSGTFLAYNKVVRNHKREKLHFDLELAAGVKPSVSIKAKVAAALLDNLLKANIEYRKLYASIGSRALPFIRLLETGHRQLAPVAAKSMLGMRGKKPRVVLR